MNLRICSPFCSVKFPVESHHFFGSWDVMAMSQKEVKKMGTPESYAAYALENHWCGEANHKNHPPIELYDWVGIGMI